VELPGAVLIRQNIGDIVISFRRGIFFQLMINLFMVACSGGGSAPTLSLSLDYRETSVIYAVGEPIVVNAPLVDQLAVTHYTVSPPLPAGLSLDPQTGVIAGTPTAVTNAEIYTVSATCCGSSATSRIQIEVKAIVVPPSSLRYPVNSVQFPVARPIPPIVPTLVGGQVTHCTVSPHLPPSLRLDPRTGVIAGVPVMVVPLASFTVSCGNRAGNVNSTIGIGVTPVVQPPTSLAYADMVYSVDQAIPENRPQATGGAVAAYTVTPPLPDGLSLDVRTGWITGTPRRAQSETSYVITGSNSAGAVQATVKLAVDVAGAWNPADSMSTSRSAHTSTLLANGKVLIAGGGGASGFAFAPQPGSAGAYRSAELYDSANGQYGAAGSMHEARIFATATLLPNGKVLVAGGASGPVFGDDVSVLSSAELYDPATNEWTATGSMQEARTFATATLLPNGKVLVAGGENTAGPLSSAELYDPDAKKWTATGSMQEARAFATATLLANGKVLVGGGTNLATSAMSSAELYDPFTGRWRATGAMRQALYAAAATLLPNGDVLAVGGLGFDGARNEIALPSAELYDPSTGNWVFTGSMHEGRSFATALPLPNGKVLAAGGLGFDGARKRVALSSAELYDPVTKRWTDTGSLVTRRFFSAANLLPNGKALLCGGESMDSGNSSCELFQ